MANRMVGLVGTGKGPRVWGRNRVSRAHISNLVSGEVVVRQEDMGGNEIATHTFTEDGQYELPACDWISFSHFGASQNLLCVVYGD